MEALVSLTERLITMNTDGHGLGRNRFPLLGSLAARVHPWLSLLLALLPFVAVPAGAAETIPPPPPKYFNDFAGVTRPATQQSLNAQLEQFEKESSCQIVVAVFPKLPEGAALEDFTHRTATAWRVGRKGLDNGAALFVFVQDRAMRIEVGYGLEGKIPDAIAKRITSEQIKPHFQRGD